MSGYQKCTCGVWVFEPQEAWHDEPRKYGVVRHHRDSPCWATPNDPPESAVMVDWTWKSRAEFAEEEVERLTERLVQAEAAIARVRHLATTGILAAPDLTEFDKGYNTALLHLQKALEGDNDE